MLVASGVNKILVCGPSNAAIDEIVLRIVNGKLFGILRYFSFVIIHIQ